MEFKIRTLTRNIIRWLSDIIPEVFFQTVGIELTFLSQLGKNLLLNHAEPLWNTIDDFLVKNVHSCVDFVTDKLLWLLYKTRDSMLLVSDYDTKSAWVLDCGEDNGSHFVMALVEVEQFLEWILTQYIAVKDKEDIR